ncbi:DUF1828 domain-containing protein [Acutalibacter muris]|jgi:hypothetical protein|uniref:DUF1828 domain-containing protein n=1 Tax=Acutalibacter muris TaxID=1796620 RepID=UPI001C3EDA62|nr:DUF1828 domain-containing protein [Acutalibacter muris]MCI9544593.1 DUF1828 domain-containing protein [Acutalibacter muris]
MLDLASLKLTFTNVDFREKRPGIYKVLVPFFYEDGDMFDIFVEELSGNKSIRISDYGLTLMKLSYGFDIDSEHKKDVLETIVTQNRANLHDGMIYLDVLPQQFSVAISQFAQIISKVSNMDIMSREVQRSLFPENLRSFIMDALKDFNVTESYTPTSDKELVVDYKIDGPKPIFLYGVNENTKAAKVVISCLSFKTQAIPFHSLVVHEDMDGLTRFNRAQLTNVVQKQYFSLDGFQEQGLSYIKDELSA